MYRRVILSVSQHYSFVHSIASREELCYGDYCIEDVACVASERATRTGLVYT